MKIKLSFLTRLLLPLAIKVLKSIAQKASPVLRQELGDFVLDQADKAKTTENQFDDIFWDAVRRILGI